MATRIQLRRDTAANWTSANPVLSSGEPGYETDSIKYKIGDGVTTWSGLDYFSKLENDHDALNNLDYASAGHTDFASATALTSTSGVLQADIDTNAGDIITNASDIADNTTLIATTSGSLQNEIDTKSSTLLELTDTPVAYDNEKYLMSTASGTEWITISEIDGGDAAAFYVPRFQNRAATSEVFNSANTYYTSSVMLDSTHVCVSYQDRGNAWSGTSIIGTISGTSITFSGSESVFNGNTDSISSVMLDSTHVLISYRDDVNSKYGTSIIGTINGTSITFGSESIFNSAQTEYISSAMIDSTHVVVSYSDSDNSNYGTSIIGTISGTSITFSGSEYVFSDSASSEQISSVMLDSTHFLVSYRDWGNSSAGTSIIGTISGTSISWGSESVFNSAATLYTSSVMLDSTHVMISYQDIGNSVYGTSIIGTIDGTSISWGTASVFNSGTTYFISSAMIDSTHVVVSYSDYDNSHYGTSRIGTIDGTSITWGSENVFNSGQTDYISSVMLDSTQALVSYRDIDNASYGTSCILY